MAPASANGITEITLQAALRGNKDVMKVMFWSSLAVKDQP
jgi:hypothetical protein